MFNMNALLEKFKMASKSKAVNGDPFASYLRRYGACFAFFSLLGLLVLAPYGALWLYESGDAAVERAVAAQAAGEFAIFGSALSQDFMDYKLRLYKATKPEIVAIGSSRVMQFRGAWFREPFVNMGGAAGNIAELRCVIDASLAIARPVAVIIGLDFWWFLPQWEKNPQEHIQPTSGSYNLGLESLKKPWAWLLEGKISLAELAAPLSGLFGKGFRADRYGIMAQQTSDGFGPDGSWNYTAEITGQKQPFDFQFKDTLGQVENGIKAFYHAEDGQNGPDEAHVDALAEIWCKLRARGIQTFMFIPPLADKVLAAMNRYDSAYAHLFKLREAFLERGIEVMDFTNPRSFASSDCEFVDGFHGGEIAYARILRRMADHWPRLLPYVNMERLDALIRDWQGHALAPDQRLTLAPEVDFMRFGCVKKVPDNKVRQ